ncbi:Glyoxalase-like domain containing protein [Trema orientale]|uniref:Glyoxalase-like domain containing protein n=1 Tax=Trema orientale TaxID=63057 RepID=A0A2P5C1K5_TREOI|nr:Glyoxalase-like domain containing protein [Trema orientale]
MMESSGNPLHLKSLNHISLICSSVKNSLHFYQTVLGFCPIRRPDSFGFDGAWLFNYGIGIHLLQSDDPDKMPKITRINPKDNHISFQCESMETLEKKLKEMEINYVKTRVEESGIHVDQIFFHDPDGLMIEICNCDNLPVIPLTEDSVRSCSRISCNVKQQKQQQIQQAL